MQIQFLNAPDFTIDETGKLERSGSWLLTIPEATGEITTLAEQWAGAIHDPWRIPDAAGTGYTLDPALKVCKIECQALDSRHCQVKFTASNTVIPSEDSDSESSSTSHAVKNLKFERKNDLTEYKTITYQLSGNALSLLPGIGDMIDWAGTDYRCESVICRQLDSKTFEAELKAVNIAIEPAGRINSEQMHDEEFKTGSWLIMPDALESFSAANALHKPAIWAGDDFYIYKVSTLPADSAQRTQVTLTARRSKLEMIESLRSEEIIAMASSTPDIRLVWQSRWRATADDREIFANKLGTTAADWTGDDHAIVCKVTPKRISDCEFEYLLEARYPEDIGRENNFDLRDLELPDRLEYYTRIGEMRLSAGQCGYTWRHNGTYRLVNNWQPDQLCPLAVNAALAKCWINQPIKLLEIVEVSFLSGTSADNLSKIVSWFNGQRVANTTIAGVTGCFLKYDLEVDDIVDSYNREWTRISKVYRKSPAGYNWNSNYWL